MPLSQQFLTQSENKGIRHREVIKKHMTTAL